MDFKTYRQTQVLNLGWSSRPDFPPSAELVRWIPVSFGMGARRVALEIGCNDGKGLAALWGRGYRPIGCDIFLALGQKAAVISQRPITVGDVHALPFRDRSVAVALFDNGLEHCHDVGQALREIARVLTRPGSLYTAAPLQAKRLSPCHLWEVSSLGTMVDYLHAHVPEATVMRVREMIYPPEHQILMHFQWNE
jgi:SAM-dependent methyltransferase